MTARKPLVLADDGLIAQLQAGDRLPESLAAAQILLQNNAIIRLLVTVVFELDATPNGLDDATIEDFIAELQT